MDVEHWQQTAAQEIVEFFSHNPLPPDEAVTIVANIIDKYFQMWRSYQGTLGAH